MFANGLVLYMYLMFYIHLLDWGFNLSFHFRCTKFPQIYLLSFEVAYFVCEYGIFKVHFGVILFLTLRDLYMVMIRDLIFLVLFVHLLVKENLIWICWKVEVVIIHFGFDVCFVIRFFECYLFWELVCRLGIWMIFPKWNLFYLAWFGLVLGHINHCRLFNANSIFIYINSAISNNSV